MRNVPRSPYEDSKYKNEGSNDNGKRSTANRAFPILAITHAVLPNSYRGERRCPRDGSPFSAPHPVHCGGREEVQFASEAKAVRIAIDA
jgi:hypothetical protein